MVLKYDNIYLQSLNYSHGVWNVCVFVLSSSVVTKQSGSLQDNQMPTAGTGKTETVYNGYPNYPKISDPPFNFSDSYCVKVVCKNAVITCLFLVFHY